MNNATRFKRRRMRSRVAPACFYCGVALLLETATTEHLIPLSRGGVNSGRNFELACLPCNRLKGKLTLVEFLDGITDGLLVGHRIDIIQQHLGLHVRPWPQRVLDVLRRCSGMAS